jgi:hypothetical protein
VPGARGWGRMGSRRSWNRRPGRKDPMHWGRMGGWTAGRHWGCWRGRGPLQEEGRKERWSKRLRGWGCEELRESRKLRSRAPVGRRRRCFGDERRREGPDRSCTGRGQVGCRWARSLSAEEQAACQRMAGAGQMAGRMSAVAAARVVAARTAAAVAVSTELGAGSPATALRHRQRRRERACRRARVFGN